MNKARLRAFSDGVFGFAITLLVLGVQVPVVTTANDAELRSELLKALSQLVPYVTSFGTIGIIWLNHHAMFQSVERVDHATLTLNLLLLLVVTFIPYPTAVLSRYGALPSSAFLYGCTLTALGIAYSLLWMHIARRGLSSATAGSQQGRRRLMRNLAGCLAYSKRVASGNLDVPAVVGMTWIRFRDHSELDRICMHAARIIQDFLDEPGFISIVTGAAGDRSFTVHAWENEAALHNALEKSHLRGKHDFRTGDLSFGVWTRVWKPDHINCLKVRCTSCSQPNDATRSPRECVNCGQRFLKNRLLVGLAVECNAMLAGWLGVRPAGKGLIDSAAICDLMIRGESWTS